MSDDVAYDRARAAIDNERKVADRWARHGHALFFLSGLAFGFELARWLS